ncbi:hypothetical protein D3C71_824530 [compost metagenome]
MLTGGGRFGPLGGDCGKDGFAFGQFDSGGFESFAHLLGMAAGIGKDFEEFGLFLIEPCKDLRIVRNKTFLADDILAKLRETARQLVAAAQQAVRLVIQLGAGNLQALQGGGHPRFIFAQFRQLQAGDALLLGRFHLALSLFGDDVGGLIERAFCLALGFLRLYPANMQQGRFAGADIR